MSSNDPRFEGREFIDSESATLAHIEKVKLYIERLMRELARRAAVHDASKLEPEEKPYFDHATPIADLTFGSPEYQAEIEFLGPALAHHYRTNRHHPEHHPNNIEDMDLVDLVEMFCDWCASSERHNDGDIGRSFSIQRDHKGLPPVLAQIMLNTAKRYGMGANHRHAHLSPPSGEELAHLPNK